MSETKVYDGTLANGVKYEVHEAQGFSERTELAIKIEGEFAIVLDVSIKRGGNIEVKPNNPKTIRISKDEEVPAEPAEAPNFDDVIGGESGEASIEDDESLSDSQ